MLNTHMKGNDDIYNRKMNKWVEYDDPGEWSSECSVGDSD